MEPLPLPTLRRARLAVATVFLVNGCVFGSWAPHIPLVQERLGLGPAVLGAALLAVAVGGLAAMILTGWLVGRVGSGPVTAASGLLMGAAVLVPALAPDLPVLVAGLALQLSGLLGSSGNNGTAAACERKPDRQADAAKLVEGLTGDNEPYRYSALEVQAQAALAAGDKAKAKTIYEQLKQLGALPNAPQGVAARAEIMLERLKD